MTRTRSRFLAAAAVLLAPMAANAVPIVISGACVNDSNLQCAFGVDGLELSTGTFNVEFVLDSYNNTYGANTPLFFGNFSGATEAVNAITGLLDSLYYGPHGNGSTFADAVLVPTGVASGACAATGPIFPPGSPSWTSTSCSTGANTVNNTNFYWAYARFTAVVPEPGTLALLGIGLLGMGLTRRKKV